MPVRATATLGAARATHPLALFASVSRLHIVAIGSLAALTFSWIFFGTWMPIVALAAALDWFLVNLLNRVVDIPEDQKNGIVGTDFVSQHRRALTIFGFALLGASLVVGHSLAAPVTPFRLAFHTLGLAYNWPLLPGGRRIKQLYFWKNFASAMGFVLTVFAYPLALGLSRGATARIGALGVMAIATFFVLFEISYEVLYDLRDLEGDREADVRTYAVVHGERVARRIVLVLIGTSTTLLVGAYAARIVPWKVVVMVAAPLTQLAYVHFRREVDASDCIRLTWIGAGMLGAYDLWVIAGLPGV